MSENETEDTYRDQPPGMVFHGACAVFGAVCASIGTAYIHWAPRTFVKVHPASTKCIECVTQGVRQSLCIRGMQQLLDLSCLTRCH